MYAHDCPLRLFGTKHPFPSATLLDVPYGSLFETFPDYLGACSNTYGSWPISRMRLSKPTGLYVSKASLWALNLLMRRHAIMVLGNNCAPGLFFPKIDWDGGWQQFYFEPFRDYGIVVFNALGHPADPKDGVAFSAEPFMVLQLRQEWKTFDDYLGAMHSKYRVRARKVFELSAGLQRQVFQGRDIPDSALKACSILLQETLRHKTIAMNGDLMGMLSAYRNCTGNVFHLHLYKENDQLLGFISWLKHGNAMMAMHVGYQAGTARQTHIYQRMLYDLAETAIENNLERINFGRTATEIKSTLGAEPVENSFVIITKNPIFRSLALQYRDRHHQPAPYQLRKPFK